MSLLTRRAADVLQNLHYTYDPAGNIIHIRDDAQPTIFFNNQRVEPSADYTYDALYRLIEATGREHLGQIGAAPSPHSYNDTPRVGISFAARDGNAMGRYLERYVYDVAGNFDRMKHVGTDPANPGWERGYVYGEPSLIEAGKQSNRLTSTSTDPTKPETYSTGGNGYDAHGNMLRMPHLQEMRWDFNDQLCMTQRQKVNASDAEGAQHQGERTWYVYDAGGQRVRKVTELATGQVKDERIYLGGFEIYRRHGVNPLVRETLHIMDDKQRIALVETRTAGLEAGVPPQLIRFQFGNHLGSASLELDDQGRIIFYEEYTPYGSTSYQGVRSQTETPKRYRYTGKERDEESGFYYHGARYYAPWLGRWTSCDPVGLKDGTNCFAFVRGNPVKLVDPSGTQSAPSKFPSRKEQLAEMIENLGGPSLDPNALSEVELDRRLREEQAKSFTPPQAEGKPKEYRSPREGGTPVVEQQRQFWLSMENLHRYEHEPGAWLASGAILQNDPDRFSKELNNARMVTGLAGSFGTAGAARAQHDTLNASTPSQKPDIAAVTPTPKRPAQPTAKPASGQAGPGGTGVRTDPKLLGPKGSTTPSNLPDAPNPKVAVVSGLLRDASRIHHGNAGIGTATLRQAVEAGRAWVGEGYSISSAKDQQIFLSANKLRQFRVPTFKPRQGIYQANFEQRSIPKGQWQGNAHVEISKP